jgi:hypothetical protein
MRVGTWPTAMFSAEPVMKAEMETSGIRSTIQPHRMRPMKIMMQPAMTARAQAISDDGTVGWLTLAFTRIWPTSVDITATGCEEVSGAAEEIQGAYADGDVLGGSEEPIDQNAHEGGVEAVLRREVGEGGIGHTLRDDDGANGDAWGG